MHKIGVIESMNYQPIEALEPPPLRPMSRSMATIFLVDPHKLVREGLKRLFENTPFRVIGESATLPDALHMMQQGTPADLVLLEPPEERDGGIDALQNVLAINPLAKIVVLATDLSPAQQARLLGTTCALLRKDISPIALMHALQLVMLNERVYPIDATFLPAEMEPRRLSNRELIEVVDLSTREMQTLQFITRGMPNKAIARELGIAETTVKARVKTILKKIKAGNRTQAAIWYINNGI